MKWVGRALLANEQGGPLPQLRVIPQQPALHRTLGAVVVHAAVVFLSRQRLQVLKPFITMIGNPGALAVSETAYSICDCDYMTFTHGLISIPECIPTHYARR